VGASLLGLAAFLAACGILSADAGPAGEPPTSSSAIPHLVPLAGNAFETGAGGGGGRRGGADWSDPGQVRSVFFHVDRPAELHLGLRLRVPQGQSEIRFAAGGREWKKQVAGDGWQEAAFGTVQAAGAGYLRVDLAGLSKTGPVFAEASDLVVGSATPGLVLSFVRDNQGNRFYWGRRGPSVHLGYRMPTRKAVEYAYSELTVPAGADPVGSYFMANGFGEGYFGIQVNSPSERRILFSVWSPFHTDNPAEIPETHRVVALARGEGVQVGEFGNEGAGGQSFLRYPWQAGSTYRFLTRVHPDGAGNTIYAGWFFAPEDGKWRLIARFKRPQTNKHLTGFHSFLENFNPATGHLGRRAWHANQWVRDVDGGWHEVTAARFTGDDIASRGYRRDFAGGAEGARFFLRNCGFFNDGGTLNTPLAREAQPQQRPEIDLAALE
jgi:hypothetical protein